MPIPLHSLTAVASSFITGIWLHSSAWSSALMMAFIITGALTIVAQQPRSLLLKTLLSCAACGIGYYRSVLILQYRNNFLTQTNHKTIDALGSVTDINEHQHHRVHQRITLKIFSVKPSVSSTWNSANQTLDLYLSNTSTCHVGDTLLLSHLHGNYPPHSGDLHRPLTIFSSSSTLAVLHRPSFSLMRALHTMRTHLTSRFKTILSPTSYALFSLIFLGHRESQTLPIWHEYFLWWGLAHYLARAGLHFILILILWRALVSFLPFFVKQAVVTLLLLFYTLISWQSIPTERALLSFLIITLCLVIARPISPLPLISLIALLFLWNTPYLIYTLDFQLSFFLTAALAYHSSLPH